jgi:hypothetical protein
MLSQSEAARLILLGSAGWGGIIIVTVGVDDDLGLNSQYVINFPSIKVYPSWPKLLGFGVRIIDIINLICTSWLFLFSFDK